MKINEAKLNKAIERMEMKASYQNTELYYPKYLKLLKIQMEVSK